MVSIEIDGKNIKVKNGSTILDAAKELGIYIPTLCYNEKLKPYGGCRLCMVEIIGTRSRLVASCGYYVEDGLKVSTDSPKVKHIRKLMTELLYAMIPESKVVQKLAKEFGIKKSRYHRESTYCINCNLCVRYCDEIKGLNAVGTVGRGQEREIAWIPLSTYEKYCKDCNECMSICPTGVFPSNWGLAGKCKE